MQTENLLIIDAIKTEICYYIKIKSNHQNYFCEKNIYLFDGQSSEPTFHKNWFKIQSPPKKITYFASQPSINYRFELINKELASEKIPLVLKAENVAANCMDYDVWKPEYNHLQSLYQLRNDPQPHKEVEIDFKFNVILEIDRIEEYGGLHYPIQRTEWGSDKVVCVTYQDIQHQLIDSIIFPDILLISRPCQLTSKQSYDIVRYFIKTHIDLKVASIDSDYNFCFGVSKKIALTEPEAYQAYVSSFSSRKPKYKIQYRQDRKVTIFEMTHSLANYKGYTQIEPFKGENTKDLQNNVDNFLNNLIKKINKPLIDCPHCKGYGVVLK